MNKLTSSRKFSFLWIVFCSISAATAAYGQERLLKKFAGRAPIFSLRFDYPNPALLAPEDDCGDGIDDDADGATDYLDIDCQGGLGPQDLALKLPFDVIQPVGGFAPARFTGANRNGDPLGDLLINSTGPGGRKLSYLRTGDPNTYGSVVVRAVVLPGKIGDQGGPVAIRIQPANAPTGAGRSYFVKTVPGSKVSIEKDLGDGTTAELASKVTWGSGEGIQIQEYNDAAPAESPCYRVEMTAVGSDLTATVSEVNCLGVLLGSYSVISDRTVTLNATDGELREGYVGLRSDNDPREDQVDDQLSAVVDPSVLDYTIGDPQEVVRPDAPRIAFFNCFTSGVDAFNYGTRPISHAEDRPHRRSMAVVGDTSLASYLRSLGFLVDEYHIASFAAGIMTPDFINDNYDLFWLPSSGGSADTRAFARGINIPFVFAEHVVGSAMWAGLWEGTGSLNGNENQQNCSQTRFAATLTGAQEAPDPVETSATGFGTFKYDPGTRELSYNIEFSGLSSAESAAHIHQAAAGEPGPVIHPLPAGSPKVGTVTLSEAEGTALLAGLLYVNVHSANHGGGEIRGQILGRTLGMTTLRVISQAQGGNPNHPLVRGLGDAKGDILVHDSNQIPLNLAYPLPGDAPGLSGAGFKTAMQTLSEKGWGPGTSETQFAGWPPAPGGVALAAMLHPCNDEPMFQLTPEGTLNTTDGKAHIHLMAAEAGSPRVLVDPENCPEPCVFGGRTIFYWISDPIFPYSTPATLSILRRAALWGVGLLDSENRSDIPFKRGDANADGNFDLSDPVSTLSWLFLGAAEPSCVDAADSNDDETADLSDAVYSLNSLFLGGPLPASPHNINFQGCGLDLTPAGPEGGAVENPNGILSCKEYSQCRS